METLTPTSYDEELAGTASITSHASSYDEDTDTNALLAAPIANDVASLIVAGFSADDDRTNRNSVVIRVLLESQIFAINDFAYVFFRKNNLFDFEQVARYASTDIPQGSQTWVEVDVTEDAAEWAATAFGVAVVLGKAADPVDPPGQA